MKKKFILKDESGKYYTKYWDEYWSKDFDQAHKFDSEEEILKEYQEDADKNEGYSQRFSEIVGNLMLITLFVIK